MELHNGVKPSSAWYKFLVQTRYLIVFLCLLILGACAMNSDRYLFPNAPQFSAENENEAILFQEFSEDFLMDNQIGEHTTGSGQRKLKIMSGEAAGALQPMVAKLLADRNQHVRIQKKAIWDLTLPGLETVDAGKANILLGGKIKHLSMNASTLKVRVATEYEFKAEVECFIGRPDEKKVYRRTVRFNQKVINFSSSQRIMDELLNNFLNEAASQVVENVTSFLK